MTSAFKIKCYVCGCAAYRIGKSYLARCATCNKTQHIINEDRRRLDQQEKGEKHES